MDPEDLVAGSAQSQCIYKKPAGGTLKDGTDKATRTDYLGGTWLAFPTHQNRMAPLRWRGIVGLAMLLQPLAMGEKSPRGPRLLTNEELLENAEVSSIVLRRDFARQLSDHLGKGE